MRKLDSQNKHVIPRVEVWICSLLVTTNKAVWLKKVKDFCSLLEQRKPWSNRLKPLFAVSNSEQRFNLGAWGKWIKMILEQFIIRISSQLVIANKDVIKKVNICSHLLRGNKDVDFYWPASLFVVTNSE